MTRSFRTARVGWSVWLTLGVLMTASTRADELPKVADVEFQPLSAQVRRVVEALDYLGQPLSRDDRARLDRALASDNTDSALKQIQDVLDLYCLIGVEINPESRVKAAQGPATPRLVQHGWRVFLVKVHNEAGVTAPLVAVSPNAAPLYKPSTGSPSPKTTVPRSEVPQRWMDVAMFTDRPLTKPLSGLNLEYRILQVYSRDAGRREAKISFNVGQGTQDLGFRSDVDILFTCEPAVNVVLDVKDVDGRPTMASFLVRDAKGRVYLSQSRRLGARLLLPSPGLPGQWRVDPPASGDVQRRVDTRARVPDVVTNDQRPARRHAPRDVRAEALGAPREDELVLGRPPRPRGGVCPL
ncbi:MAG: hypothetical protein U0794_05840 [Isosphaeraceae bacterium]